jgi:hypothetical protein
VDGNLADNADNVHGVVGSFSASFKMENDGNRWVKQMENDLQQAQ